MISPHQTEAQPIRSAFKGARVREMQIKDIERIAELERESFSTPWSPESIAYEVANNPFAVALVVDRHGLILAYVIGWCFSEESHIGTFAVDPAFRGNGLGSLLLKNFIAQVKSRDVPAIHLEVRQSNSAAQQLYFNHGFEQVGLRRNYYTSEREDALLLSLYLEESE
ncbi:MAG TPA: ribosomal protein S18-alanine N-acetyltransferase [bacterium]